MSFIFQPISAETSPIKADTLSDVYFISQYHLPLLTAIVPVTDLDCPEPAIAALQFPSLKVTLLALCKLFQVAKLFVGVSVVISVRLG